MNCLKEDPRLPCVATLSEIELHFGPIRAFSVNVYLQLGKFCGLQHDKVHHSIPSGDPFKNPIELSLTVVGMVVLAAFDLAFGLALLVGVGHRPWRTPLVFFV